MKRLKRRMYPLKQPGTRTPNILFLKESRTEIDFLNVLAGKKGVVLMYGPGFSAPEGTVRISLANLNAEDYTEIARRLFELLDDYADEYEQEAMKDAA